MLLSAKARLHKCCTYALLDGICYLSCQFANRRVTCMHSLHAAGMRALG